MKCVKCAVELFEGAKFCPDCGTSTEVKSNCPHCSASIPADSTFCTECGTSIKGGPSSVSGPKVEQVEPKPAALGNEFVYFVGEEQLHKDSHDKRFPPYGCIGVVVVNGRVERVYNQVSATIKANKTESTPLKDLYERLVGGVKDFVAYRQNLLTYVISSLRDLPVITYSRKPNIPGSLDDMLKFEFWITHPEQDIVISETETADPAKAKILNNIGVFLTKFVSGKAGLTFNEFKSIATEQLELLLAGYKMEQRVADQGARNQLMADLEKLTGISGRCTLGSGRKLQRYQFDISKAVRPVACPSCSKQYTAKVKFCEECGHDLSPTALWVDMYRPLASKEGQSITLRLSLMRDRTDPNVQVPFDDDIITTMVVTELEPLIRRTPIDEMLSQGYLKTLSAALNEHLPTAWQGFVKDFEVLDLRTTEADWFFRTDALVAEQLRVIEADKRSLAIGEAELDLEEVKLALAMREVRFRDDEYLTRKRQEYETARKAAELDAAKELEDHSRETQTELKKEQLDTQAYSERAVMERQRMSSDRQTDEMLRQDEHSQVDHEISLEKKAAGHDIDLKDMAGQAESRQVRREIDDKFYVDDQKLRIDAERAKQMGNIEEDLVDRQTERQQSVQDRDQNRQIDKLRAMAELEAKMAEQDQKHELSKAKQEQDHELAKRENMKDLSAAEMLAIQAAELAQAGGAAAAADIVKAIAQSQADAEKAKAEAAGSGIKEEMYERMLKMQEQSTQATIDAHKNAASISQSVNEKAMEQMAKVSGAANAQSLEGFKSAAEIAKSTNEKSMDSMAKVATATASRKVSNEKEEPEKYKCVNTSCDKVFDKPMKFCPGCGHNQQAT